MVKRTLTAANAAEIEAQNRKTALCERLIHIVNDLIVHRPAKLRMRMKNDRDRRTALFGGMEAPFKATSGTCENDLGHLNSGCSVRDLQSNQIGSAGVIERENKKALATGRTGLSLPEARRLP